MSLRKLSKKRWVIVSLLLGAVGCAKVELPRIPDRGPSAEVPARASAKDGGNAQRAARPQVVLEQGELDFDRTDLNCNLVRGLGQLPRRSRGEYARLRLMLERMSPLVQADRQVLVRAQKVALLKTNQLVMDLLDHCNQFAKDATELEAFRTAKAEFSRRVDKFYGDVPEAADLSSNARGEVRDFRLFLGRVLPFSDRDPLLSAYLRLFYGAYVHAVDPFGGIVFDASSGPSEPNTLAKSAIQYAPQELRTLKPIQYLGRTGSVVWATFLDWSSGSELDALVAALEQAASASEPRSLVLDLRYAGGSETAVLDRLDASAARGWGRLPLILIVNDRTHGTAALFTHRMASRSHVQVLGTDPATYGFGRVLAQRSAILYPETSPITVTLGTSWLQLAGQPSPDGYQYRLRPENVLYDVVVDDIVRRAESAPAAEAPEQPVQPSPVAAEESVAPAEAIPLAQPPVQAEAPQDWAEQPEPAQLAPQEMPLPEAGAGPAQEFQPELQPQAPDAAYGA